MCSGCGRGSPRYQAARSPTPDEEIERAVVVVVPEPRAEALDRRQDTELARHVLELAVAEIVVEVVLGVQVADVEIGPAVLVVVAKTQALRVAEALHAGALRDVVERAVAVVAEELVGRLDRRRGLVADVEVEIPVVVDVGPGRGRRRVVDLTESRCEGHVDERAVAGVLEQ
jgi:hypothetical protein